MHKYESHIEKIYDNNFDLCDMIVHHRRIPTDQLLHLLWSLKDFQQAARFRTAYAKGSKFISIRFAKLEEYGNKRGLETQDHFLRPAGSVKMTGTSTAIIDSQRLSYF